MKTLVTCSESVRIERLDCMVERCERKEKYLFPQTYIKKILRSTYLSGYVPAGYEDRKCVSYRKKTNETKDKRHIKVKKIARCTIRKNDSTAGCKCFPTVDRT